MRRPNTHPPRAGRAGAILIVIFVLALAVAGYVAWDLRNGAIERHGPHGTAADRLARELASAYFTEDKLSEARRSLEPLLESRPELEDIVRAVVIENAAGNGEEARKWIDRGLRKDSRSPELNYIRARMLIQEGLYTEALPHLRTVEAAVPDDIPTILSIALVLKETDLSAAETYYRKVVDLGVDHAGSWYMTAIYQLAFLLQDLGREQEQIALLDEYTMLDARGLTVPGSVDRERGNLGLLKRPAPAGERRAQSDVPPNFKPSEAFSVPNLPGSRGVLIRDLLGTGEPGFVSFGKEGLHIAVQAGGQWASFSFDQRPVEALEAFDVENDGDLDLVYATGSELRMIETTPMPVAGGVGAKFEPWPEPIANVKATDIVAVDFDHEGDLDLLTVGPFGPVLLRNDGASQLGSVGSFNDATGGSGLPTGSIFEWCAVEDFDTDQDVDFLLGGPDGTHLASNLRGGKFEDVSRDSGELPTSAFEPVIADFDGDGRPDLWAPTGGVALYLGQASGRFRAVEERATLDVVKSPLQGIDCDLDGTVDAVRTLPREGSWIGWQALGFPEQREFTVASPLEDGARLAAGDLDGDGHVDGLVLGSQGALFLKGSQSDLNSVALTLAGKKDNRRGVGAVVELSAGGQYQRIYWRGESQRIGLGSASTLDWLRVLWPNGVVQYDLEPSLAARTIEQVERLVGSCPFLYTWNGSTYEFISDVLGITPLGLPMAPGMLVPPDHDEYVLVRGEQLVPKDGLLELQFTEELREVTYLDRVRLEAIDHPADSEIFPNERFSFPPFPEPHTHTVRGALSPQTAMGSDGGDWTAALGLIDGEHARPFENAPPQYQGLANPHWIELSFDPQAVARANKLRLLMTGWLYWTNASVNMAAARHPTHEFVPPILQVPDGAGGWRATGPPVGFPAGKTKTMVLDVTDLLVRDDPRVRVFCTLQLFWDSIRLAVDDDDAELLTTSLEPSSSRLWRRGFSDPLESSRPNQPELFDWERLARIPRWNPHPGLYTKLGEVLPLVTEIDDRFVIMASGDCLTVRFDASELPPVRPGFRRDYLVFLDGWAKDRDPNTVEALNVEPLPFHGMSGYPYRADESFPHDEAHRAWRREWNTRDAESWLGFGPNGAPPSPRSSP